jgi:hypothetical protein
MNAESVEQLITFFKTIAYQTHEDRIKVAAFERILTEHQELKAEYQECLGRMRFVPAARADRQQIAEALEALRQTLLRDRREEDEVAILEDMLELGSSAVGR